jgi:hypothetical protein
VNSTSAWSTWAFAAGAASTGGTAPGKPSHEARVGDLVRGLVNAVEPDPSLVGPLVKDYECVAEAIASAASLSQLS